MKNKGKSINHDKKSVAVFFNHATKLLNENKLDEAITLYKKVLTYEPNHIECLANLGIALLNLRRLEESIECYSKKFPLTLNSYYYYLNKGLVLKELERFSEAHEAYDLAISCGKERIEGYLEKGILFHKEKKWVSAIECYDVAVGLNDKLVEGFTNRAIAFEKLDNMSKAHEDYLVALSSGNLTRTRYSFGNHLLINGQLNEAIKVFKELLECDDENRFKASIMLAIISYTKSDFRDVAMYLADENNLPVGLEEKPLTIYKHFLASLLRWRKKNLQWYLLPGVSRKIYFIGESHSLTAQNLSVYFENSKYSCKSQWIMGIKQFHLFSEDANPHKRAFLSNLSKVPEDSPIVFAIGEIDSRANEGYVKNYQKTGEEIETSIPKVVKGYLDFIKKYTTNKNLKIIVQGIPSPVIATAKKNDVDQVLRKKAVKLVNKLLQKGAAESGFYFLDVYSMTDNGDGETNHVWHLDGYHLKPSSVAYAFAHHLVKPVSQSSNQPINEIHLIDSQPVELATFSNSTVGVALHYHPEAYTISGPKLMGRNAAGESFLRGFLSHSKATSFFSLVQTPAHARHFEKMVSTFGRNEQVHSIEQSKLWALAQAGLVYYPSPEIGKHAFERASYGAASWSICSITNSSSSAKIIDSLAEILTAPIQTWDALICTSIAVKDNVQRVLQAQADYLKNRLGITKLVLPMFPVIPIGVHTSDFEFSDAQKDVARKMLCVSADELVVLSMGRLSFHANAHPLAMYQALEAASIQTGKKVVLVECGWHNNDFIQNAYSEAIKLAAPCVRLVTLDGRKAQDKLTAWASTDVFCSLSDNMENFGIAPLEAMAASLPVVVSDWDGHKDSVRDGIDGFRIPTLMPQAGLGGDLALTHALEIDSYDIYCGNTSSLVSVDVEQTTKAFVALFNSKELRLKMGMTGKQRAKEVYDWSVIIAQYEALWAKQTEVRLAAATNTKALKHPWPARMDPFDTFASYPTGTLKPETVLKLNGSLGACEAKLQQYLNLDMVKFAKRVIPSRQEIEMILKRAALGECEANELVQAIEEVRRPYAFRALAWLIKLNILSESQPNAQV